MSKRPYGQANGNAHVYRFGDFVAVSLLPFCGSSIYLSPSEATTRHIRHMIALAEEHERALLVARKCGIEAEAMELWRQRCTEAEAKPVPTPLLRDCVRDLLAKLW